MADAPLCYWNRPAQVEAWQVTVENRNAVAEWCGGRITHDLAVALPTGDRAAIGDYVVKTADGTFSQWGPDSFTDAYFPVREPAADDLPNPLQTRL